MSYRIPEPPTPLKLPCSGERLEYNLRCIGWTFGEAAKRLQVDPDTIKGMCRGERAIPDVLATHMETIAAFMRAMSQPPTWQGRDFPPFEPPFYAETTYYPVLGPEERVYNPRYARLSTLKEKEAHARAVLREGA